MDIFCFVIKLGEFIQQLTLIKSSCFPYNCKPFDFITVNFAILFSFEILKLIQILPQKPENIFTRDKMGNRRNRRSRRLETPSPERSAERTQVETPNTGNITLTNPDTVVQESLDEDNSGGQLVEPSQIGTEIQAWTQIFEQRNNDRIEKIREEMDNKLETILREIKSNKSVSVVTNPGSENTEMQNIQPTGSNGNKSIGVHASNNENSETEEEDFPLRASKMKDLKHPAKPLFQTETDVDVTMHSDDETNSESEQEYYHMVTGSNRKLHRQSSQKSNDTLGSHADHNLPNLTTQPPDPVNQIAIAIEKLVNKNSQQSLFHPKNTLTFNGKNEKNEKFEYFEDLFPTTLRMQPNLTEDMKINHFHAHLRGLALKTFENIQRTPTTTLEDILKVFRRKYVKPKSSASAKHRFNRLSFEPEHQNLPDFLEELQESAEKAFGENAHQMIENLLCAKMPPHLKKSINQAYLENGTYEQIVKHLEREMELNGLEADESVVKTQMTVTKKEQITEKINKKQNDKAKKQTPKTVPDKTLKNDQCRYCKETGHMMADCPKLAKRRKLETDPDTEKCQNCNTLGHDEENCYFGANMENRRPKWNLTEAQKKIIEEYKQAKKPIRPKSERSQQSSSNDLN